MNLAGAIRNERLKLGISQKELATRASLTSATICNIEKGRFTTNSTTLALIAKGLDIPLVYLLFLAIEDEDIQPNKKAFFDLVKPAIVGMFNYL